MANANLLSNSELIAALGLPKDIMDAVATKEGDAFVSAVNTVLNAVNKIAYQKAEKMNFSDPFKKYDGKAITYGTTIENLWIEPPKGYKYDPNATDPFGKQSVTNKALYATINYDMQYQTTIQRDLIRKAVLNEGGLMELINYISESVATQTEIDTYEATIRMLNNKDLFSGGFTEIDVTGKSDAEKAKIVARKIKDVITDFALPCHDNNALKVMNVCPKEHALLIIKQSILNDIDFDFLSGVYNLSKVDLASKIIPVRDFRTISVAPTTSTPTSVGDDLAFMVIDDRGFDNHVALRDGGSIYNPKGRYINQFTDLWKIISFKYWFNAKAFKLKTAA